MHKPLVDADTAVKHLLRNLHDAASLRTNPLVAHFFVVQGGEGEGYRADCEALERVQGTLRTIVERSFRAGGTGRASVHLERQREILLRCDLGGASHKTVQDDLALERRQFYRERQRARSRLSRALLSLMPAHIEAASVNVDAFTLELTHVRALRTAGDGERAIAHAERLLHETTAPKRRVEVLCFLTDIYAEHAAEAKAEESLAHAHALDLEGEAVPSAQIALSESHVAWLDGRILAATLAAERAVTLLRALGMQRTAHDDELLAAAHLQASISHHMLGAYDATLANLQGAREVIERRNDLPPRLTVNVLFHLGGAHAVMPGCGAFAESHLSRAFEIATRNELVREAAHTALNLANLYLVLGDLPRSLEVGHIGIGMAKRVLGKSEYAWAALSLAAVELAAGNFERVVELTNEGRSGGAGNHLRTALADIVEADALLRRGRPESARQRVSAAVGALSGSENQRFLGYALRVSSEASHQLGETKKARHAIEESVELLERYGHPFSLASALRSSAIITGDRSRQRDADDLLATIRSN